MMVLDFFRRGQRSQLRKERYATLLLEFKEIRHWINWRGRYMSSKELKKEYGIKRPLPNAPIQLSTFHRGLLPLFVPGR